MKYIIKLLCIIFVICTLLSCSSETLLSSVNYESCFMNYQNPQEIQNSLDKLNTTFNIQKAKKTEKTIIFLKPVIACLTYQMGRYQEAEQWLLQGFKTEKNQEVKSMVASALGLMYLKEQEKHKIENYIEFASEHYLGRWMLILYYIDSYRDAPKPQQREYLLQAINQLQSKNKIEGTTTATKRFLAQLKLINNMEIACSQKQNPKCVLDNLLDEKEYLFSTAYGFLNMLLKKPPFNIQRIRKPFLG